MGEHIGLVEVVSRGLIETYRGLPVRAPGRVFTDLGMAVADGAYAISGLGLLRDRGALFGAVASMPTAWRVLDRVDRSIWPGSRPRVTARAAAACAAGAGPELEQEQGLNFDATIPIATKRHESRPQTLTAPPARPP